MRYFESQGSWQHCVLHLGLQLVLVNLFLKPVLARDRGLELARKRVVELVLDLVVK